MYRLFSTLFILVLSITSLSAQKTAPEHFRYGYEFYLKNEPQKALEHFNTSIKLDPEVANVYFIRATTKMLLKDYLGAINDYQTSLEKGYPSKRLGYKYMAEACMLNGDRDQAAKYLEESEKHQDEKKEEPAE